jgi:hypothetical protein
MTGETSGLFQTNFRVAEEYARNAERLALEWLTKGDFAMQLRQGILWTVASLMCASAAFAQTKNTSSPTPAVAAATKVSAFKDLDKNSDGYINRTEAASSSGLGAMFSDLDANKDGKLSSQEYAKRTQHP